jgi:hypothetical protein
MDFRLKSRFAQKRRIVSEALQDSDRIKHLTPLEDPDLKH